MRPAPLSPWSWGGTGLLASLLAARAAQLAASQRWSGSGRDRWLDGSTACFSATRRDVRRVRGYMAEVPGDSAAPNGVTAGAAGRRGPVAAQRARGSRGVRRAACAGAECGDPALPALDIAAGRSSAGPGSAGTRVRRRAWRTSAGARRLHQHLPRAVAAQLAVQLTCAAVPTPPPPSGACRRSAVKKQKLLPPWWAVG